MIAQTIRKQNYRSRNDGGDRLTVRHCRRVRNEEILGESVRGGKRNTERRQSRNGLTVRRGIGHRLQNQGKAGRGHWNPGEQGPSAPNENENRQRSENE